MKLSEVLLQHGRALEWMTSALLLAFAVTLALPGDTLAASPSFAGFVSAGLDEAALAMPISWIAAMRMAGLYVNGAWRRSPLLRMIGAVLGAGVFAFLSTMFALPCLLGSRAPSASAPASTRSPVSSIFSQPTGPVPMLDILNGLDEAAWAGLTALLLAIIDAIGAVLKGMRRHPAETGQTVIDPFAGITAEIRALAESQNTAVTGTDRRFDRIDRELARIHTDTQVIRERSTPR